MREDTFFLPGPLREGKKDLVILIKWLVPTMLLSPIMPGSRGNATDPSLPLSRTWI